MHATPARTCIGLRTLLHMLRTRAGTFGLMDMHGWVSALLPDLPTTPPDPTEAVFAFKNTLLGTQLVCR